MALVLIVVAAAVNRNDLGYRDDWLRLIHCHLVWSCMVIFATINIVNFFVLLSLQLL